jgi:hypothetical protein
MSKRQGKWVEGCRLPLSNWSWPLVLAKHVKFGVGQPRKSHKLNRGTSPVKTGRDLTW